MYLVMQVKSLSKVLQAAHKGRFLMDSKILSLKEGEDCHSAECLLVVHGNLSQDVQDTTSTTWLWQELSDGNQVTGMHAASHMCSSCGVSV